MKIPLVHSLILCLFGLSFLARAELDSIAIPRINQSIDVDGNLNEPHWQQAKIVSLNYVTSPFENTKPPVETTAYLYEDKQNLYLAFVAQDPRIASVRGAYRDRDDSWGDDLVGIKLDTFNDQRLAYQFFVNPFGSQMDSIENELTGSESDAWDAIWDSASKITDTGYQVEMVIPLSNLNFKESSESLTWGVELLRFYPREFQLRISHRKGDRNNDCDLCQMGEMTGFAEASQGRNLQIVPTLVVGRNETRDLPDLQEFESSNNTSFGLSVNWGITSDIDLSATLNPDFSQVEADSAQLSINNSFALSVDEKRSFFVKNDDYFNTPEYDLVYTRNISEPDWGAKITGRQGQHTFALFSANDVNARFLVPGILGSRIGTIDSKSTNTVMRYRFDASEDLSLGAIGTAKTADNYHNYVAGLDGRYRITDQDLFRFQYLVSDTQYPQDFFSTLCDDDYGDCDQSIAEPCEYNQCQFNEAVLRTKREENFRGSAFSVRYNHDEEDWWANASYRENDSDFNAHLGWVPRADFKRGVFGGGLRWYNEEGWWNQFRISGDWDFTKNDNGDWVEREIEGHMHLEAIQGSYIRIGGGKRERAGQRLDASGLALQGNVDYFDEYFWSMWGEIDTSNQSWLGIFVGGGDQVIFANNELGRYLEVSPEFDWDINNHLTLSVSHVHRKMDVDAGHLFTANLTDLRLTLQFDSNSFIRLVTIYDNTKRSPENYLTSVDAKDKEVANQILYGYKINPLTLFFVGYSDSYVRDDDIENLKQDERSVFMKISYAFQL